MGVPQTIEEMLVALTELGKKYPGFVGVPPEESVPVSHRFAYDFCKRILELEQKHG